MIIPTPEFDPMFADDGVPFRDKMIAYIQREFSDLIDSSQSAIAEERFSLLVENKLEVQREAA